VFLFDEPLSNLDAELRVQMRTEIAKLHHRLGATMIYVTHDQTEAMTMADRIVVLRAGRIEQQGAPIELYERPANLFVAGFLGAPKMNLIEARVLRADGAEVELGLPGDVRLSARVRPGALREGDAATLGLRPDNLRLDGGGALTGEVDVVEQLGPVQLVYATLAGPPAVVAEVRGAAAPRVGEAVRLSPGPGLRHVFDAGGQAVTLHDGAGHDGAGHDGARIGEGRA
jgi:multiple sugar transport system ATP-binding protein